LTVTSYEVDQEVAAYIEPVAVGGELPDAPLFLEPGGCVLVPMEATYRSAFEALGRTWHEIVRPEE
jgi:hypothetical protein